MTTNEKNKILLFNLCISVCIIIGLCIFSVKHGPVCNRTHLDDLEENRDIIPDEKTAKQIADVLVEINLGFEEDKAYDAEVIFNEQTNEWEITYFSISLEGQPDIDDEKIVRINRGSGHVIVLGEADMEVDDFLP